ncbi:30S ribosomal protein S15 [archaeon]|nr:30S ribosomal protein S15 [archaeon]
MARMHTGKRGKSGSTHPPTGQSPSWLQFSREEVVQLITQLAKQGKTASIIGVILRDQYGIPSVKTILKKSLNEVLRENGFEQKFPEDLMNLLKKAVRLRKHVDVNKKDVHNTRSLELTESKIRKLISYYKRSGRLDWQYTPEGAALIVK